MEFYYKKISEIRKVSYNFQKFKKIIQKDQIFFQFT